MKPNNNDQWRWHYGVTRDLIKNNLLLVYHYYSNLPENLLGVTLKYKIDGLIDKLHNTLNELMINRNDLSVETIKTIETTTETLKTIEDCANYEDKEVGRNSFNEFCILIDEIGIKHNLVKNLFEINTRLNKEVLCKGCYKVKKLIDKCGNREIAKFLYECRLNRKWYYDDYIQWIPFGKFKNIGYLAEGDFGEVRKATWTKSYYNVKHKDIVLKRICNSGVETVDILKEVKFTINTNGNLLKIYSHALY